MTWLRYLLLLMMLLTGIMFVSGSKTITTIRNNSHSNHTWTIFKRIYKRSFNDVEESSRREVFQRNVDLISKHNIEADLGLHSFWLEVNRFTDMTNDEYRQYLGYKPNSETLNPQFFPSNILNANNTYYANPWDIPSSLDWRSKNVVTPVKDQGECTASFAYASISSIESQHAIQTGTLTPLSEQQIIDCSLDYGNEGCLGGGLTSHAFRYIIAAGGIDSEEEYPFVGEDSFCRFTRQNVSSKVSGFVNIVEGDESVLKDAVANVGPTAVAVDAGSVYFQFYSRGIFDYNDCQRDRQHLNHALTVIGYGSELSETPTDYWIMKNSWGVGWGDEGYIRLRRNQDNLCGIASHALYPLMQNF